MDRQAQYRREIVAIFAHEAALPRRYRASGTGRYREGEIAWLLERSLQARADGTAVAFEAAVAELLDAPEVSYALLTLVRRAPPCGPTIRARLLELTGQGTFVHRLEAGIHLLAPSLWLLKHLQLQEAVPYLRRLLENPDADAAIGPLLALNWQEALDRVAPVFERYHRRHDQGPPPLPLWPALVDAGGRHALYTVLERLLPSPLPVREATWASFSAALFALGRLSTPAAQQRQRLAWERRLARGRATPWDMVLLDRAQVAFKVRAILGLPIEQRDRAELEQLDASSPPRRVIRARLPGEAPAGSRRGRGAGRRLPTWLRRLLHGRRGPERRS